VKSKAYFASAQPTIDATTLARKPASRPDARELRPLHLPQQAPARAHRAHDRELARALLARGR
jgi:hypothetical protein